MKWLELDKEEKNLNIKIYTSFLKITFIVK